MLKIVLTAGITAITCFAISAATGLGAETSAKEKITLKVGDHITLPAIGWACDYSHELGTTHLVCSTGTPGTDSQGDPVVLLEPSQVRLLGSNTPALQTFETPKCCIRIWAFPATRKGSTARSDLALAPGNVVSIPRLDLFCRVLPAEPDRLDPGPVFYCIRQSTTAKTGSASMEATRTHMRVSEPGAKKWAYTATRSP